MSSLLSIAIEFANSYQLSDVIFEAKGAYKETFRARDVTGKLIALKLLDPAKCNLARSEREIAALKKCHSPLIAKVYDYGEFAAASGGKYYFSIEEYLDGGTLTNRMGGKPLPPSDVISYATFLIQALECLKEANLVHRDIKPDNIMFRKGQPESVLVDFGLVRDLSESSLTQTWLPHGPGTPYYAAPEQLNNDKHLIGWRTDQFSVGVVMGICLTGFHPFGKPGATIPAIVDAVANRRSVSAEFEKRADTLGFNWLLKTLGAWPIQRYSKPNQILESMKV